MHIESMTAIHAGIAIFVAISAYTAEFFGRISRSTVPVGARAY